MCKISKIKLKLSLCYNNEADRGYIQKVYKEEEDISGKKKGPNYRLLWYIFNML